MFKLLKTEDKNLLGNSNFAKNAILYKDMLCFFDAYEKITERKDELPNFCFLNDGKLCLEGICLLMKMYATEFKFETIKLTLDYLKILYYVISSFADDEGVVSHEIIAKEFEEYRKASIEFCDGQKRQLEEKQNKSKNEMSKIKRQEEKCDSLKKGSKICFVCSIVLFVLSVLGIALPVLILNIKSVNSPLFAISIAGVIVGFLLAIWLLILKKKLINTSADLSYHVQGLKKNSLVEQEELDQFESKYFRVFCEKYEYEMCFSEIFSRYAKVLTIDEILEKAKEYKLLSYNIVYDINRLFKSQQKEIESTCFDIENIVAGEGYKNEFETIYNKILRQDWLYYNAEIRFHFLKRFADISEKEHEWKLDFNGQKINPFDVDVRGISREKIAYSISKDTKLISSTLSDFIKTNYFKNLEEMNFKNGYSVDALKRVKSNYLSHFYDAGIFEDKPEMFYDKKMPKKLSEQNVLKDGGERIPTLVNLKLKLIENSTGLGNSDAKVVKSISQSIFGEEKQTGIDSSLISEADIEYPKFTSEKVEEFEDCIVYSTGNDKKIGYKVN